MLPSYRYEQYLCFFCQFQDYRPNIKDALGREHTRRREKQVQALESRILFLGLCFPALGGQESMLLQVALAASLWGCGCLTQMQVTVA